MSICEMPKVHMQGSCISPMGWEPVLGFFWNDSLTETTQLKLPWRSVNLQFPNISVRHRLTPQIAPLLAEKWATHRAAHRGVARVNTHQGLLTYRSNNFKCWVSAAHILIFSGKKTTLNLFFMISCRGAWTVCCGTTGRPTTGFKVESHLKLN